MVTQGKEMHIAWNIIHEISGLLELLFFILVVVSRGYGSSLMAQWVKNLPEIQETQERCV